MEAAEKVHQGRNIKLGRNWKKVTQEALAFDLQISQKQISELEAQETVDDLMLNKIASSLKIPVDFLKTYNMEEAINVYNQTMHEPTLTNTSAENSHDAITQQIVGEQENTYNSNYPIDDIKDLYKQIIDEKDKQIIRFEKQVDDLQKQIEELRSKIK